MTKNVSRTMDDHNLLIRLDENVKILIQDVKDIKDTTAKWVDTLESTKEDKVEVSRLLNEANKIHDDHEGRIRYLESVFESFKGKYAILAVLGMMVVSIITSYVIKQL